MKRVNVHEAKARLSAYLDAVERGERVVICRRNRAVAELRPVSTTRTSPRPLGGAAGLHVPKAFFDPLPDDIIDLFYAGAAVPPRATNVAERAASKYGKTPRRARRPRR